ncbi:hypothetical protein BN2475_190267 [Paraburkholderia ribeironis]|uniref:Uncharacterized protein n=1 Tax=Paraburkholderia ribeironis TaxID=1247936 RepID=A0A1N7RXK0_9BURK|nr:hypothetical protein BN2475_190267 [Paraburkholderia ribeironis]
MDDGGGAIRRLWRSANRTVIGQRHGDSSARHHRHLEAATYLHGIGVGAKAPTPIDTGDTHD